MLAFVVAVGAGTLAYFDVVSFDVGSARSTYESAAPWVTDQTTRLKDLLLTHLPSYGGGAAGLLAGWRRR